MKEVKEYIVVNSNSPGNLTIDVQEKIKDGWKLYGNPFAYDNEFRRSTYFCQAMVR